MDMKDAKITISDSAKEKIKEIEESGLYLKVDMGKSGCCSYSFEMYPDKLRGDDELFVVDGHELIFTKEAQLFAKKLDIDYGRKGLFNGFIGHTE